MNVKFLTSVAMPGSAYTEGATVEVAPALGKSWIKNGWCIETKDEAGPVASRVEMSADDQAQVEANALAAAAKGRRATLAAEKAAKAKAAAIAKAEAKADKDDK